MAAPAGKVCRRAHWNSSDIVGGSLRRNELEPCRASEMLKQTEHLREAGLGLAAVFPVDEAIKGI